MCAGSLRVRCSRKGFWVSGVCGILESGSGLEKIKQKQQWPYRCAFDTAI